MCTLFEKLNDHFWRALLFIVRLLQYDSHDFQQLDLFPFATGSPSSSLICIAVSGMYLFPLNNATVGNNCTETSHCYGQQAMFGWGHDFSRSAAFH